MLNYLICFCSCKKKILDDYDSIDVDDILDIHKYQMKNLDIKLCLGYLNKCSLHY